ncbi:MAG: hypothetical protein K8953_05305 [Proteobacteria bacterium]|nr:hypothetical protein [Pseudomonadota bacterium]
MQHVRIKALQAIIKKRNSRSSRTEAELDIDTILLLIIETVAQQEQHMQIINEGLTAVMLEKVEEGTAPC